MQTYFLSRITNAILLLFGVVLIVFFLVRLTGDPTTLLVARDTANAEQIAQMRAALGLDRPLPVQFFNYLTNVAQGDLGYSLRFRQQANGVIFNAVPITLALSLLALFIAVVVAIPLGVLGGYSPNTWIDLVARLFGLIGQTVPSFWLALILILVFAINLQWLPSFGADSARHYILPALALSVGGMGQLVRLTRSAVLEIRHTDYIRTARGKGLSQFNIAARHIFRNASLALISVIGVQFTYAMAGSIYIESIFAIPGLGWLLNEAIVNRDFVLVQSVTLVIGLFVVLINLLTDILYGIVDPRIR
ncbi:MAG: ABC transporter permease [Caldilineaceae bacterium]|nr:ABC transporter permease [Caldilineaceae bacterium]